ncbi:MAG TPA: DUF309 domain-containing protein [Thermoanaerobaculia bacterium]|nr:DUF309 domain-containing protein [Thermoanaerobaculia bacterium]
MPDRPLPLCLRRRRPEGRGLRRRRGDAQGPRVAPEAGLTADPGASFAAGADPLWQKGLEEFRAGRFFEAHEEWERLWKGASGPDRRFLQGLIQLAAALVHVERGRTAPAVRLLRLAREKLDPFPDGHGSLALGRLREAIDAASGPEASGSDLAGLVARLARL